MPDHEIIDLRPGLRSADSPRADRLFDVSAVHIPPALSKARCMYDEYRCVVCEFTAAKYQMTWQYGASARALADLRTACPACWQTMNLESTDMAKSGCLIWLPELTQTEVNRRMPELYIARVSPGPPSALARLLLNILKGRAAEVVRHTGIDDLSSYVRALRAAEGQPARIEALLSHFDGGLRLLPLDRWIVREAALEFNRFPQLLAYWRSKSGPLYLSPNQFATIAHDWLSRLGEKVDAPASG